MDRVFDNSTLAGSDLIVDAVYEGAPGGSMAGEPMSTLLPGIGNRGGFRSSGSGVDKRLIVLYTSGEEADWPDRLDPSNGQFSYFGDNRRPGRQLHETPLRGNQILRRIFDLLHSNPAQRAKIPPIFVFEKHPTATSGGSVQFRGLAVPGFSGMPATNDLVAIWKSADGQRFQNYLAEFTILDVPVVSRPWIDDIAADNPASSDAPTPWLEWVNDATYRALVAERTTSIRSIEAQLPDSVSKADILRTVWEFFRNHDRAFEHFAAQLFVWHDPKATVDEITRPTRDGGRDAIGRYSLGVAADPIHVEFSLEAKCYRPPLNGVGGHRVGVREVARLISRIRNRQLGVLVTTSVIGPQVYKEVREDGHPIIFISGGDIAEILTRAGWSSPEAVQRMLLVDFGHLAPSGRE